MNIFGSGLKSLELFLSVRAKICLGTAATGNSSDPSFCFINHYNGVCFRQHIYNDQVVLLPTLSWKKYQQFLGKCNLKIVTVWYFSIIYINNLFNWPLIILADYCWSLIAGETCEVAVVFSLMYSSAKETNIPNTTKPTQMLWANWISRACTLRDEN